MCSWVWVLSFFYILNQRGHHGGCMGLHKQESKTSKNSQPKKARRVYHGFMHAKQRGHHHHASTQHFLLHPNLLIITNTLRPAGGNVFVLQPITTRTCMQCLLPTDALGGA